LKALALLLLLSLPALAQPSSVAGQVRFNEAGDLGFKSGVGVGAELNLNFKVVVPRFEAELLDQPKEYFDSGKSYAALAEVRIRPLGRKPSTFQPFVSAGYRYSGYRTPEWTKGAGRFVWGVGASYNDQFIVYSRFFLKEKQTVNQTSGWQLGLALYQPVRGKWLVTGGWEAQFSSFLHPPCSCRLGAVTNNLWFGVGRTF
jgi:hypothetical protein